MGIEDPTASRDSYRSSASASSIGSTDGVLQFNGRGSLEEFATTNDGTPMDTTFTGLILSGKLTQFVTSDHLTGIGEENIFLDYFPDPPCVLPPDQEDDADKPWHDQGRKSVVDYWKDHAKSYDMWPKIKRMREIHSHILRFLGGGRFRTSSILNNRLFVNVTPGQVGIRSCPTTADWAKTDEVIEPGEMVPVMNCEEQDGVRFWKLKLSEGYMFEFKDGLRVMQEAMNVETGSWWYRVACSECLEIRSSPGYEGNLRSGWILSPGELVVIVMRCRMGSSQFLLLADGRGWVFTWKPVITDGGQFRASHDPAMEECNTDFLESGGALQDFRNAIPATDEVVEVGHWTYVVQTKPVLCLGAKQYGTFLCPGDIIRVDKKVTASGGIHRSECLQERVWVRLLDKRGWVPVHGDDGFEQLKEQDPSDLTYPSWFAGQRNLDEPPHSWMTGFC